MKLTKLAVAACLLLPVLLSANDDASEQAEEAAVPEAQVFTSEDEIRIDGERIKYTATARLQGVDHLASGTQ